jgi:hypothetical protein
MGAHLFHGFRLVEVAMLAVIAALLIAVTIHGYSRVGPTSPERAAGRILAVFRGANVTIYDLEQ